MKFVAFTQIGLKRSSNQDTVLVNDKMVQEGELIQGEFDHGGIIVADGMGGLRDGKLASQAVAQGMLSEVLSLQLINRQTLVESVNRVHYSLLELSRSRHGFTCMGSTLCAFIITPDVNFIVNVGDTRCYEFGKNGLDLLTVDDHVDPGESSVLSQCIGGTGRRIPKPHIKEITSCMDSSYILCTDGFYKEVDIEKLLIPEREDTPILKTQDDCSFLVIHP